LVAGWLEGSLEIVVGGHRPEYNGVCSVGWNPETANADGARIGVTSELPEMKMGDAQHPPFAAARSPKSLC